MTEDITPYGYGRDTRAFDDEDLVELLGELMADIEIRAEKGMDGQLQEWLDLLKQIHNYLIDRLNIDAVKEEGQE